jgi:hypothetical protein
MSSPRALNWNDSLPTLPMLVITSLKTPFISPNSVSTSGIAPANPDFTLVNAPIAGPIDSTASPMLIVDSNLRFTCSTVIFICEIIFAVFLVCANSFDNILLFCTSCFCKLETTWLKSAFSLSLKLCNTVSNFWLCAWILFLANSTRGLRGCGVFTLSFIFSEVAGLFCLTQLRSKFMIRR